MIKIILHAHAKGEESVSGFKFGTFIGRFPRDGAARKAVKGLINFVPRYEKKNGVVVQLIPLMVMDVLGQYPGLPGLFVACVFSASLRFVCVCAVSYTHLRAHETA